MTRLPHSTKFPKPRDIAAQARLFAEIAADCSRGILPGDYTEAGISDFAAEVEELFWEMRIAEADSQSVPRVTQNTQADSAQPDGLRTPAEAARKLRCSIKTLNGYVRVGALRYVIIGHGKKRPRKMFTDADLDAFIANQTRKDVPCPSTATRAPRSGNTTSRGAVIAFSAQPKPRPGGKPKK